MFFAVGLSFQTLVACDVCASQRCLVTVLINVMIIWSCREILVLFKESCHSRIPPTNAEFNQSPT